MEVTVSNKNNAMIVAIEGRLDTAGSSELEDWTDKTIDPPGAK